MTKLSELFMERTRDYINPERANRILNHYEDRISKGMDLYTALDKAVSDYAGNNGHPKRDQRLVMGESHV